MVIAIDGPGGAGKSTVARLLARDMGVTYIDTGAMYRAVALAVLRGGLDAGDAAAVRARLPDIAVDVAHDAATGKQAVYLNGEDVTALIRSPEVTAAASAVATVPEVRVRMVELQREIARGRDVVMDGRDIGTHVFPDAGKKYFLTASPEIRAQRRYLELAAKSEDATYERCLADLRRRDENDSTRAVAPLRPADDALLVDTGDMTAAQVAAFLRADILRANVPPVIEK